MNIDVLDEDGASNIMHPEIFGNPDKTKHFFVGEKVDVDFISESRTEFSGNRFKGRGVIDRIEDGRIFGRLDNGNPFMCFPCDVLLVKGEKK